MPSILRFKAGGLVGGADAGVSRMAQAIAGGGGAYDTGYDQGLTGMSKLAAAAAQAAHSYAAAREANAKADDIQSGIDMAKPDAILGNAMTGSGIPAEDLGAVRDYLNTGQLGGKYAPVAGDGEGPVAPQPRYAGPGPVLDGLTPTGVAPGWQDKLGPLGRQIMATQNALTVGDKDSAHIADSVGKYANQGLRDDVLGGRLSAGQLAAANYAEKGEAPYSFHEFGVGNNLTGAVDASGAPAQLFAGMRTAETAKDVAQTGAATASAAHSYASADAARASAAKTRQEIDQGIKSGMIQIVQDSDGNTMLVNKATGISRPATSEDGVPLKGNSKGMNAEQANALTFATRMQAAQDLLAKASAAGADRPGGVKQSLETIAGATPFIGDKLADVAGTATNWTQSNPQQSVEQAQRDFVNAILRRESGAAISSGEFDNARKQYFPQAGDSEATKLQKLQSRQRAIDGMMAAVPINSRPKPNQGGATGSFAPSGGKNIKVTY